MKKFVSLALALVMALSLVACSGGSTVIGPSNNSTNNSTNNSSNNSSNTSTSSAANSGMVKLAEALKKDGFLSDGGDYVFGGSRDNGINAFISYSPSENTLSFLFGQEDENGESFAGFEYDLSSGEIGSALFSFELPSGFEVSGFATLNPKTYNSDNPNMSFSGTNGSLSTTENDLANAIFNLGMACWNLTLLEETGMTMNDLGFINY